VAQLPARYYVQLAQSHSRYPELVDYGWRTVVVTFDRAEADAYATGFEGGTLFEEGEDVSEETATITRVVTAEELLAESGDALAKAECETTKQLWQKLEAWARPLVDPADR
jgi:hypothetical protein